jgi:hypothetical protein
MGHGSKDLSRPACFTKARACGLFLFSRFAPHAATAAVSQPPRLGQPPRRDSRPARLPLPLSAAEAATGRQRPAARPPVTAARPPPVLGQPPRRADAATQPFPFPAVPEAASDPPARPGAAAPPPAARSARPLPRRRPPWIAAAAPLDAPARTPKPPPDAPPPPAATLTAPPVFLLTARSFYFVGFSTLRQLLQSRDDCYDCYRIVTVVLRRNPRVCVRAREKMAEVPPHFLKISGFLGLFFRAVSPHFCVD